MRLPARFRQLLNSKQFQSQVRLIARLMCSHMQLPFAPLWRAMEFAQERSPKGTKALRTASNLRQPTSKDNPTFLTFGIGAEDLPQLGPKSVSLTWTFFEWICKPSQQVQGSSPRSFCQQLQAMRIQELTAVWSMAKLEHKKPKAHETPGSF